jgi:hypothetical protein
MSDDKLSLFLGRLDASAKAHQNNINNIEIVLIDWVKQYVKMDKKEHEFDDWMFLSFINDNKLELTNEERDIEATLDCFF